jgi:hypothetical protein
MKLRRSKNDIHDGECVLRPCPKAHPKFRSPAKHSCTTPEPSCYVDKDRRVEARAGSRRSWMLASGIGACTPGGRVSFCCHLCMPPRHWHTYIAIYACLHVIGTRIYIYFSACIYLVPPIHVTRQKHISKWYKGYEEEHLFSSIRHQVLY